MNPSCRILFYLLLLFLLAIGCTGEKPSPLFEKLTPDQSGINFVNTLTTSDSLNVQNFPFIYNGGGVAAGDVNGDGLSDLYFTGNQVSSRLYLNKGNMQFEDVTESAGVATNRWASGASMVDINGNGSLDIYVSVAGPGHLSPEEKENLLFINNGDGTFTESAAEYNLADTSFTTHAAFLDYDGDGHLDVYLLNNSPDDFVRGAVSEQAVIQGSGSSVSYDKLYRNNGDGTFSDVSREAGLLEVLGYGLGVVVSDLNRDGWPDIFISNDILPSDVLYINNGDGTFTDKASEWLKHTSFAGMGTDIADFNNDGWPDILQVDMMPEELRERKRMSGHTTYNLLMERIRKGFHYQYALNTLQLSNGFQADDELVFSEIARQSGVAYTHWSWSALFADFDNDGHKDIQITNGYPKAVNDFDYMSDMNNASRSDDREEELQILEELHSFEVPNYIFRNDGNLGFIDQSASWGLDEPGYSYGAVYVDLNNNGRLDLVMNNINSPAAVYENLAPDEGANHYLQVQLKGETPNVRGIGSEVVLTAGGKKQYLYHNPYRGYQSSVDNRLHFGLSDHTLVDSLEIFWADGRYQLLTRLSSDQLITVHQEESTGHREKYPLEEKPERKFKPVDPNADGGITWEHQENDYFIDFSVQPLLPHQLSRLGPALATGDVTGNGLDDVYVGGAAGQAGKLFLQDSNGRFNESTQLQPWEPDSDHEDTDALFFDANGNGLLDLYVVSGGNEPTHVSRVLQDRLYINQGNARFLKQESALPEMITSGSTVAAGDFTGNGLLDLFVGGRLVPRNYPSPARSYLLRNDGGEFTDVTEEVVPELAEPGMITDAVWMDIDNDGRQDLITSGIWLPIQFYKNDGDVLRNVTESIGLEAHRGWWYSLAKGDFNQDGQMDLVAGNLGLNHTFTTSREQPFGLYASDYDENRQTDLIFTKQMDGRDYPFFGFAKIGRSINTIGNRYPSFEAFSDETIQQVLSSEELNQSLHFEADNFASVYLQNNGDGTFTSTELPALAQISPLKSILVHDVEENGNPDLIVAGNIYETDPEIPRADAGNGLWLKGDGKGGFEPIPPFDSGFMVPKDVRDMALIQTPNGVKVIVVNNNDFLQTYLINN